MDSMHGIFRSNEGPEDAARAIKAACAPALPSSAAYALFAILAPLLLLVFPGAAESATDFPSQLARDAEIELFGYEIINAYPHDPSAFTQGLVYCGDGVLYEGTGLYGRSSLRRVDLLSGRVLQRTDLQDYHFGEGITLWNESIIQLTWRSGIGIVYDSENLTEIRDFRIKTEGWGLTNNESCLFMSDGSSVLYILDPESFDVIGRINVTLRGTPLESLNELEWINGSIYANVWHSDKIAIISPESGAVLGEIDLDGILPKNESDEAKTDVLNGIAYDSEGDRLFVTGKLWPWLFEIRPVPASIPASL